jgi:predicted RNase H-like nuclease (RuvC/YqgF family)
MNIELWQGIAALAGTLISGGVITQLFFARYEKRKAKATITTIEEDVKQEKLETESSALNNAEKVIEMYKSGMQHLSDLYEKNISELTKRCEELEQQTRKNSSRIGELEDENARLRKRIEELENEKSTQCDTCKFAKDCKKRAEMLLKSDS